MSVLQRLAFKELVLLPTHRSCPSCLNADLANTELLVQLGWVAFQAASNEPQQVFGVSARLKHPELNHMCPGRRCIVRFRLQRCGFDRQPYEQSPDPVFERFKSTTKLIDRLFEDFLQVTHLKNGMLKIDDRLHRFSRVTNRDRLGAYRYRLIDSLEELRTETRSKRRSG